LADFELSEAASPVVDETVVDDADDGSQLPLWDD